jgi:hypothetical protein
MGPEAAFMFDMTSATFIVCRASGSVVLRASNQEQKMKPYRAHIGTRT